MIKHQLLILLLSTILFAGISKAEDVVIADFEGEDYGSWKVEGQAFGNGPAQGTLPNQQKVSGFEGNIEKDKKIEK